MGIIDQEMLEIQNGLNEKGVKGFFYDLNLMLSRMPLKKVDGILRHVGFSEIRSDFWANEKRIGDMQFSQGDPEDILQSLINLYEDRGFTLDKWDKEGKKIFFKGIEGDKRKINYSLPILGSASLIASFYQKY